MRGPSQPRKNAPQSACLSASSQKLPVATSHEVRRAQSKKKRFGDTSHGIVKVKKLLISPQYRKNRSATLRVVPTGSTSLRNAETPRLTTYVAQLHAWPFTNKKSTAKRVPQHSITKVAPQHRKNRSATLRVVPTGSTCLHKAQELTYPLPLVSISTSQPPRTHHSQDATSSSPSTYTHTPSRPTSSDNSLSPMPC